MSSDEKQKTEVSQFLGKYKIIKFLSKGGQGSVYICKNPENDQQVAVKTERMNDRNGSLFFEAFMLKHLNKLEVDGVLQFIDYGVQKDVMYLVQQYGGNSLQQMLQDQGSLNDEFISEIIKQGFNILKQLLNCGIVHQDIKPGNMIYNMEQKKIYLIDFGMSKRIKKHNQQLMKQQMPEAVFGTVSYMSISCHQRWPQVTRDDLESFCYSLIYLQTSSLPWQGIQRASDDDKVYRIIGEMKVKYTQDDDRLDEMCKNTHPIIKHIIKSLRQRAKFTIPQDFDEIIEMIDKKQY